MQYVPSFCMKATTAQMCQTSSDITEPHVI